MSKTDASKKSGKKKKLRKLAAQKLAHAAANNALNDIIAAAGAELCTPINCQPSSVCNIRGEPLSPGKVSH